jgi:hypothetical protein
VGSHRLMSVHHFSSRETLVYVSLPAGVLLVAASLAAEGTGPLLLGRGAAGAAAALAPHAEGLVWGAALSFLVNLTSFWAIGATGSLTFKVRFVAWVAVAAAVCVRAPGGSHRAHPAAAAACLRPR